MNAHCECCYLDGACFYGLLHLILNHPERDGRDVVDGLVRKGTHDIPAELDDTLLLTRWVATRQHDVDEFFKTCVKPRPEAVGERLRHVGSSSGSSGWRMVSGMW